MILAQMFLTIAATTGSSTVAERVQIEVVAPSEPGRAIGSYFAGLGGLLAYRFFYAMVSGPAASGDGDEILLFAIADLVLAPLAAASLTYLVADGSDHYEVSFGSAYAGAIAVEGVALLVALGIALEGGFSSEGAMVFGAISTAAIPLGAAIAIHAGKEPIHREPIVSVKPPFEPERVASDRLESKDSKLIVPLAFAF